VNYALLKKETDVSNTSRKKQNGLVHRMSTEIKGKQLAHAFKLLRTEGLTLWISDLDGVRREDPNKDKDPDRINVQVKDGCVLQCWIG